MKKYACLDSTNSVTQIADLDIHGGERIEGIVAYIQVTDVEGTPGIFPIPSVGQIWNGETLTFN
jgi:hypothetical protein